MASLLTDFLTHLMEVLHVPQLRNVLCWQTRQKHESEPQVVLTSDSH